MNYQQVLETMQQATELCNKPPEVRALSRSLSESDARENANDMKNSILNEDFKYDATKNADEIEGENSNASREENSPKPESKSSDLPTEVTIPVRTTEAPKPSVFVSRNFQWKNKGRAQKCRL